MATTLHVCTTCRGTAAAPLAEEAGPRPGELLAHALSALPVPEGVTVVPVECLSACTQGCAVALSGPGKWSYVYGRLDPRDADTILTGAAQFEAAEKGLIPWRERPEIFRKQCLARIPPQIVPSQE
ncbi:DUF1636 family protein [Rhodobacter capsulatus]|jgi:predicted metal-binding protein|uniref:DUF1636 domain-containing protein n=3 Tax=Rhodobacter capsulatus TaxID=1061 RepID=D5AV11_RHOCB|nr:DUF1636 domain-containing protein [Rhodobacter capsulatus]AAB70521.1 ORF378 [Rhodobacter capsulatus]AAC16182.1 hypothetical protein [Rhodobacter capsulatus SB 1003]ADE85793.1 protein of unknown function DUF1636 [Rhodobacter capsulatus SB 1003]ETD01793.1 metal-binding protein [Rhodobacter capsulatus DE442]ETD76389.1 metal-binding protein [Rhodobacter capsulatus B6]